MATPIYMPDLGTTVETVRLVSWLKSEGDSVERGEALCEVETDKAATELESVAAGVLLRHVVPPDTEVAAGDLVAYVGAAGESPPEAADEKPLSVVEPEEAPSETSPREAASVPPLLRNAARRLGIDLADVIGTGPGGRVVRADIERAHAGRDDTAADVAGDDGEPLSRMQLAVARTVMQSVREVPAIDLVCAIDMTAAVKCRDDALASSGRKPSYDAIFAHAVSRVMSEFPHFRSHVEGDHVRRYESVDLAIAVAVGDDLYAPVVKGADEMSLDDIDERIRLMADRARSGNLEPDDLSGGSMTISNLGMYPVEAFNAFIPPGASAAIAIGAAFDRPSVRDGELLTSPVCSITLSVDHRLINGAEAGRFLAALKDMMESL